jgi:hypothetical protein
MNSSKTITILAAVVGTVVAVAAVTRVVKNRSIAGTPMVAAMRAELERQGHLDLFEERMKGLTDRAEAARVGAELSRKGVARLNPAQLITRAEILLELDSLAGDSLCSKRFMGTLLPEEAAHFFTALDSAKLARWAAVSATGIGAELRATADIPPPSQDELASAIQTISQHMNDADADRFGGVLSDPQAVTPAEQCWAQMAMTRTMLAMPEPPQAEVMRTVAKLEAGL